MISTDDLARVKSLIPEAKDTDDDLICELAQIAEDKVMERLYPFDRTEKQLPDRYRSKVIEITVFLYNKRGAEGETAHSENGVSRTYDGGDVPPSLLQGIVPMVAVIL